MNNLSIFYFLATEGSLLNNYREVILNIIDNLYMKYFGVYEIYYGLEHTLFLFSNALSLNFLHTRSFFFFVMFFPLLVIILYILIFLFTKFFSNYSLNIYYSRMLFVIFGYTYFFFFMLLVEDFMFFSEVYQNNLLFINNF